MNAFVRVAAACMLALAATHAARAGTACETRVATPESIAAAAATALRVEAALDETDAPVALIARVGTDLSKFGLVYSHVGFALRDHPDGRWTVVHLLNRCGTDRSSLYAQGLVDFFADDLVNQDARIVWLEPEEADRLLARLQGDTALALHEPRYNVIASVGSARYQNSTAWVLEMLGAARLDVARPTRALAQRQCTEAGHRPDVIRIPYTKRIAGGIFGTNVAFTDHPVSARLSGRYEVVTVRSIFRFLREAGAVSSEREWRDGMQLAAIGPD